MWQTPSNTDAQQKEPFKCLHLSVVVFFLSHVVCMTVHASARHSAQFTVVSLQLSQGRCTVTARLRSQAEHKQHTIRCGWAQKCPTEIGKWKHGWAQASHGSSFLLHISWMWLSAAHWKYANTFFYFIGATNSTYLYMQIKCAIMRFYSRQAHINWTLIIRAWRVYKYV